MVGNTKNPIRIDLNEFKLHIHLKNRIQLTLYQDGISTTGCAFDGRNALCEHER